MSEVTIRNYMRRLIIDTDSDELLQIKIQEVAAGSGSGDGSWDETIKELGRVDLTVEDVKVLNDVIERWMYQAIDRKNAACCDDSPRMI